jgi:hypothetical protein
VRDRNEFNEIATNMSAKGPSIVVAGPSSSLTIPGIIVSQIVHAISENHSVMNIEVDSSSDFDAGLHRTPSLAVAHRTEKSGNVVSYVAPTHPRLRAQAFKGWIPSSARAAIAFAWPGLDNGWISQFLHAAHSNNTPTMVVCVSLPRSNHDKVIALADVMIGADLVLVGNTQEADALKKIFSRSGPVVEMHPALSLQGRAERASIHQITAFLPKENYDALATLLTAYDAIPEAWIDSYHLKVVMRSNEEIANQMLRESYHGEFVRLVSEDLSSAELERLCSSSSAMIIADPAFDSRAFSIAVDCGVAVVVLASSQLPDVGRGYVGALLADMNRPVSVHVALTHALRLAELHFPRPDAWNDLVNRLLDAARRESVVTVAPTVTPKESTRKAPVTSSELTPTAHAG